MHCFSTDEAVSMFPDTVFKLSVGNFLLSPNDIRFEKSRVGGGLPRESYLINSFLVSLVSWLPSNNSRILFLSSIEESYPDYSELIKRIRIGFGENRPLESYPIHYFNAQKYDEDDQFLITDEHKNNLGIICSILSLMIFTGSNGWMTSEKSKDFIEIWENRIIFYSEKQENISRAKVILDNHGCISDIY